MRLSGPRIGPSTRCRRRDYEGTSSTLGKAYGGIRRCSEDVDLTYDIRAIAPDLVGVDGEALPKTRSKERRRAP
jgi:hypothetical protein